MIRSLWSSLRTRLIVAAVVGLCFGLMLSAWVLLSVYRDTVTRGFDDRLNGFSRIIISVVEAEPGVGVYLLRDVGEAVFERAYSGWYWQIIQPTAENESPNILLRSRSLFDSVLPSPQVWMADRGFTIGPSGGRLRIVRALVKLPNFESPVEVWVAGDYDVVENSVADFSKTLAFALLFLAGSIGLAVLLQVHFALSPMRRLRRALHAIRQGEAERLEGTYLKEIEPLTKELNALLAHNELVLNRARTEVGNLAHALKTPLSVLRGEVEHSNDRLAEAVRRESDVMNRQINHHLKRARAAAAANHSRARTPVLPRVTALVRAMEKIHRDRGIQFEVDCTDTLVFRGEGQDLDEIIGNVLDNAGKWASGRVSFWARLEDAGRLRLVVEDDGGGLDADERHRVLQRGERLDETVPGTGLGLSIVRDMVGLYGGQIQLETSDLGGLRVVILLPAWWPEQTAD